MYKSRAERGRVVARTGETVEACAAEPHTTGAAPTQSQREMSVQNPAPDSSPPSSPTGTWGSVTVFR
jgi:hypothetical protein